MPRNGIKQIFKKHIERQLFLIAAISAAVKRDNYKWI